MPEIAASCPARARGAGSDGAHRRRALRLGTTSRGSLMAADQTPGPNEWANAVQKTQEELMRQWSTWPMPGRRPPVAPSMSPLAAPVRRRWCRCGAEIHGAVRAVSGRIAFAVGAAGTHRTVPDAAQRSRVFSEGLQSLQQQFAGMWGATAFGAPLSGAAMPFAQGGMADSDFRHDAGPAPGSLRCLVAAIPLALQRRVQPPLRRGHRCRHSAGARAAGGLAELSQISAASHRRR